MISKRHPIGLWSVTELPFHVKTARITGSRWVPISGILCVPWCVGFFCLKLSCWYPSWIYWKIIISPHTYAETYIQYHEWSKYDCNIKIHAVPEVLSRKFSQCFLVPYSMVPSQSWDPLPGTRASSSQERDSGKSFLHPLHGVLCGSLISPCMLSAVLRT